MTSKKSKHLLILFLSMFCTQSALTGSENNISGPLNLGNLIWSDDFEDGRFDGWTIVDDVAGEPSNWYGDGGYLVQDTNAGNSDLVGTHVVAGDPAWRDYVVRAHIVCTDDDYIGMLFRYQDRNNYYRFMLSSERQVIRLDKRVRGRTFLMAIFTSEEWPFCSFTATVAALHDTIALYLNDQKFFEIQDNQFSSGKVGFMTCWNEGSFFDDIQVYDRFSVRPISLPLQISRGPYLQSVLDDKATIIWQTNRATSATVEYGLSPTPQWQIPQPDPVDVHEVKLEGLTAETLYYYRVRSDTVSSDWHPLRTAKHSETPFRFIVYGDNRTNFLRHSELAQLMPGHNADFIVNVGDVVQRGPRDDWDTEFFAPLSKLLSSTPIYVSIGNHELNADNFYINFAFPNSEHEDYYSFKYGNCFFIVIDNNIAAYPDRPHHPSISPGSPQHEWLWNQLHSDSAQNSDWVFVFSHVPCYTVGKSSAFTANQNYLVPLLRQYGVDVHFSGHIHDYERGYSDGVHYVVTGGGGGPLGHRKRWDVDEISVYAAKYHYCVVDINGGLFRCVVYDINGNIIDQFEINKSTYVAGDPTPARPETYQLSMTNYPNPVRQGTTIQVHLYKSPPSPHNLPKVEIYNALGKRIRVLEANAAQENSATYVWDCCDETGRTVPMGVYLYKLGDENSYRGKIMTVVR